ncbi:ectoine/hydroxyectoine ABC transporter substrate-binding protein EhuB [Halomonas kalidii]|uniref:Ectoine/hydroxyectoine ABC transporter substrate-binding protein EhuB n=1 Tax=Halomonas kalidii TaxID=3043293 RepID=A0ABT6VJX4_9GAMM|nr:ectoine/hydroxyectoine ABC transporter substrate-binding protein EhuB [Halomonas kalidii]MDI5934282.1 ectoine/hydroxyectoine ABC transporter substrate-binding protein EhuB [Halomonas kalidii]
MRNDSRTGWPMRLAISALLFGLAGADTSAATLEEIRQHGSIRIAVANEVPYGYIDEHGEPRGAGPEVALHLMDELGIESIEWIETTFGDLIPGLREGRFDMAAAEMAILPERCEQILYSEPNTTYGEGLLVRATNPGALTSYTDFAQRDDVKVAVMAGADQREILLALDVPDDRIVTIERNEDAIGAITAGEVDAYAATGLTVTALEQIDNDVEVVLDFVDPVVEGEAVRSWGGFAFGPDAEELRDAVNAALTAFKRTNAWEQILTDHGFTQDDVLNSFRFSTEQLCRD